MSVGKIALGVFIGNLAFAVLAWIAWGMVAQSQRASDNARATHEQLEALQAEANATALK